MASPIASAMRSLTPVVRNTFSNVEFAGKMRSFSTLKGKHLFDAASKWAAGGASAGAVIGMVDAIHGRGMMWEGQPKDLPDACLKIAINVVMYGGVGALACVIRYPLAACVPIGAAVWSIERAMAEEGTPKS